jgi:hypothetical protein
VGIVGINILADLNNGISCAYDANSFNTNHQLSRGLDGILEVTGGNLTGFCSPSSWS